MAEVLKAIKGWSELNAFRTVTLILAAYFFYVFHSHVGFPPESPIDATSATYLLLFLLFLVLPSAKSLKIGKWFEYEARITELREQVEEFKVETRQLFALQNNLLNTVSNTAHQNVNITLPGQAEIDEANEELDRAIKHPTSPQQLESEIHQFLLSEGADLNLALAKLRMELEVELRRILEKRTVTDQPNSMKSRFYSVKTLFRKFLERHPEYSGLRGSFDYILSICNAAIHGQKISDGHAREALQMGFKMLDELRNVSVSDTQ